MGKTIPRNFRDAGKRSARSYKVGADGLPRKLTYVEYDDIAVSSQSLAQSTLAAIQTASQASESTLYLIQTSVQASEAVLSAMNVRDATQLTLLNNTLDDSMSNLILAVQNIDIDAEAINTAMAASSTTLSAMNARDATQLTLLQNQLDVTMSTLFSETTGLLVQSSVQSSESILSAINARQAADSIILNSNLDAKMSEVIAAIEATETDIEAGNTLLGTIDSDTGNILQGVGNLDDKTPALGTALMAAARPITIATNDTMMTALDAALDVVAGDTTSIDGKTPSLGTAVMTGAVPVTIATNDTMMTALDAAVDVVAGDTTSIDSKTPALGSAAMAASAPTTIATDDTLISRLIQKIENLAEYSAGMLVGKSGTSVCDFGVEYASGTTLTLGNLPDGSTLTAKDVERIRVLDSDGSFIEELSFKDLTLSMSSSTLSVTGFTTAFQPDDDFILFTNIARLESYDEGMNALAVSEIDPDRKDVEDTVTLIDETDESADTYRHLINCGYRKNLALQIICEGGVTVTFWATLDADADDTADTGWEDISDMVFGAASIVDDSGIFFIDTSKLPDRFMLKHVTSDATNATTVYYKRY